MQFERNFDKKDAKFCGPYYSVNNNETRERLAILNHWNEMTDKHSLIIPKGAIFVVGIAGKQVDPESKNTLPGGAWQVYFNYEHGLREAIKLQYIDTKKKEMDKSINDFYRKNRKCFLDHVGIVLEP